MTGSFPLRSRFFAVAAGVVMLAGATVAKAESGLLTQKAISIDMALTMAQAAMAKCRANNWKCGVTVLDASGNVKISYADDGAQLHRQETSKKKAYTALLYRRPSREVVEGWAKKAKASEMPLEEGTIPSPPIDGTIAMGGGLPVKVGNDVIGAISISGAPGWPKDEECAAAGIAAVANLLK
ncbi:MAG: heme-binding protein [Bryobacteraceae bacterium]